MWYNINMEEYLKEIADKKMWKGKITFQCFDINTPLKEEVDNILGRAMNVSGEYFNEMLNLLTPKSDKVFYNQIVLSGRSVFAQRLFGTTTYTGTINYGAVGTSDQAVSDSDIKLVTEAKRKGIATKTISGDSVSFRFYFSKADVAGTLEEFGTFIDGTASADSGQLFNRALTGGWVKSASESLTVTVQFDLNPA